MQCSAAQQWQAIDGENHGILVIGIRSNQIVITDSSFGYTQTRAQTHSTNKTMFALRWCDHVRSLAHFCALHNKMKVLRWSLSSYNWITLLPHCRHIAFNHNYFPFLLLLSRSSNNQLLFDCQRMVISRVGANKHDDLSKRQSEKERKNIAKK